MKFLIVMAMLLVSPVASACDLSLVTPRRSVLEKPVQVKASLAGDSLTVSYSVTAPLNAAKVLGPKQYPYMFDVVELFVTFSETGFPYYEFEVSPFNQTFQVRIVSHALHQEGGDPQKIRGNFYSILGTHQSFWSSFLPRAKTANFHQPQFFQPLLQCE